MFTTLFALALAAPSFAQDPSDPAEPKTRPADPPADAPTADPPAPAEPPAEADPAEKARPAEPAPEDAAKERPPEPAAAPEPATVVAPAAEPTLEAAAAVSVDALFEQMDDLPPTRTTDLSVGVLFGQMPYWNELTPYWPGIAIRYTAGAVAGGDTRIGGGAQVSLEGPFPEHYMIGLEPMFVIDYIPGPFQVGGTVGVGVNVYGEADLRGANATFGASPAVAAHFGYSQPMSRLSRRFYVLAEPKVRYDGSQTSFSAMLLIGQGRGS
jgi:hypothetical protein